MDALHAIKESTIYLVRLLVTQVSKSCGPALACWGLVVGWAPVEAPCLCGRPWRLSGPAELRAMGAFGAMPAATPACHLPACPLTPPLLTSSHPPQLPSTNIPSLSAARSWLPCWTAPAAGSTSSRWGVATLNRSFHNTVMKRRYAGAVRLGAVRLGAVRLGALRFGWGAAGQAAFGSEPQLPQPHACDAASIPPQPQTLSPPKPDPAQQPPDKHQSCLTPPNPP